MGWIYLAESEASPWPWRRGSARSPTVKSIDTVKPFYCHEWPAETCHSHLSGMTCKHCVANHCLVTGLMSFTEASLARTSALQAISKAWRESEVGFFTRLSDLPKNAARCLFSLKTFGLYRKGRSKPSEMRLSLVDTSVEMDVSKQLRSELFTGERAGSCLLPTLSACSYGTNKGGAAGRVGKERPSLQTMAKRGLLPTLTVKGNYNKSGLSSRSGDGLVTWLWKQGHKGPLNPVWAEVFMGYLPHWTALELWAIAWFRNKRGKRSGVSPASEETS
jgi:hypothetical protein